MTFIATYIFFMEKEIEQGGGAAMDWAAFCNVRSHIGMPVQVQPRLAAPFLSSSRLEHVGRQQTAAKCLRLCHSHGKPRWSSWLQALAGPTSHLQSESTDG